MTTVGVGSAGVTSGSGGGGKGGDGNGEDDGALHGSCGCRVSDTEESRGGAALLVAMLGVVSLGRARRGRRR